LPDGGVCSNACRTAAVQHVAATAAWAGVEAANLPERAMARAMMRWSMVATKAGLARET
jgi:hypothetical protein